MKIYKKKIDIQKYKLKVYFFTFTFFLHFSSLFLPYIQPLITQRVYSSGYPGKWDSMSEISLTITIWILSNRLKIFQQMDKTWKKLKKDKKR